MFRIKLIRKMLTDQMIRKLLKNSLRINLIRKHLPDQLDPEHAYGSGDP